MAPGISGGRYLLTSEAPRARGVCVPTVSKEMRDEPGERPLQVALHELRGLQGVRLLLVGRARTLLEELQAFPGLHASKQLQTRGNNTSETGSLPIWVKKRNVGIQPIPSPRRGANGH